MGVDTDAGLKELAQFKGLIYVNLAGTDTTANAVSELRRALPNCVVD